MGAEILIGLGGAVAKTAIQLWLKDAALAQNASLSAAELLQKKLTDRFDQRRAEREIGRIADEIAERLAPYFTAEFGGIPDNELRATAFSLERSLIEANVAADTLLAIDLDASSLERHVRATASARHRSDLNPAGRQLYDFALREACNYVVEITLSLPAFHGAALREVLRRETELLALVRQALDFLPTDKRESSHEDPSVRFERQYRREIARKLDQLELFGIDLADVPRRYALSVAYITLSALAPSTSRDPRVPTDRQETEGEAAEDESVEFVRVDQALSQLENGAAFVRGEAGSGKTTLLQWLAVTAARNTFGGALTEWNESVPLFVRLREYVNDRLPLPDKVVVARTPTIAGDMPAGWAHEQLRSGRALLLIDGVDELPIQRRGEVYEWITDLRSAYPDARYIVTSRPAAVPDDWLDDLGFTRTDLQPMTTGDTRAFIDHWYRAAAAGETEDEELAALDVLRANMHRLLREQQPLRGLATTPLLCAMLCALHRARRTELPPNRVQLYRIALEMLVERRDVERKVLAGLTRKLDLPEKLLLLQAIAYSLTVNGASDVDRADAVELVRKQVSYMAQIRDPPERLFEYLLLRSGVLREPVPGRIDFIHRTFQEYLAAAQALEHDHVGLLITHAHEVQWRETVVLAAGLAQARQREALLRGLLDRGDAEEEHRHELHLLAAACLETSPQLSPGLAATLRDRLQELVPPANFTEARALASAGDLAAPLLRHTKSWRVAEAAAAVRALGLIGSDSAFESLRTYGLDGRVTVARELLRAWPNYNAEEYAREVLRRSPLDWGHAVVDDPSLLPGLKHLRRLRSVDARLEGADADLRCLAELSASTYISIADAPLSHLNELAGVRDLRVLRAMRCRNLVDISAISDSPGLQEVDLRGCHSLVDISPLGGASELRMVVLDETSVTDLTPLGTLPALDRLEASWCEGVMDLRPLSSATTLRYLDLRGCPHVSDLEPLSRLADLRTLWLSDCPAVTSLSPLGRSRRLQRLDLSDCVGLTDLDGLTHSEGLTELALARCRNLITLNGLGRLESVGTASLQGCTRLRDASALATASEMRVLDMTDCESLAGIGFAAETRRLAQVRFTGCVQISDLSPLAGLPGLWLLSLAGCKSVEDLAPLAGLPRLQWLYLDECERVTDLSPLLSIPNLRSVTLRGCRADIDWRSVRDQHPNAVSFFGAPF
jgi:Leucine-rich repeat (LRR) protein